MCVPVSFNCCASLCTEYAITGVCVSTAEETTSLRSLRELLSLLTGCSLRELSVKVSGLRERLLEVAPPRALGHFFHALGLT